MYEKPNSTSVKDLLIETISTEQNFPQDVVEKVIRFQGEDLTEALKNHSQVEISGFGVLYVAKTKLKKTLGNFEKFLEEGKAKDEKKKESITKLVTYLKEKKCRL